MPPFFSWSLGVCVCCADGFLLLVPCLVPGVLWDRLGRIGDGRCGGCGDVCDVCCEFDGSTPVPDSPGMTGIRRRRNSRFRLITLPAEVVLMR